MIYLASYKGKDRFPQSVVSGGIRFVTNGGYSHTEICIGNPFNGEVVCISSAGQEGGVVKRSKKLSPEHFDIIELDHVTERQIYEWFAKNKMDKYDWVGCFRFLIPFISGFSKTRWFCSEVAAEIIGLKDPWRYNPSSLHTIVESLNRIKGEYGDPKY